MVHYNLWSFTMQIWSAGLEEGDGNTCPRSELPGCCTLVRQSDHRSPQSGSTVQVQSSGYIQCYKTVESIFVGAQWICGYLAIYEFYMNFSILARIYIFFFFTFSLLARIYFKLSITQTTQIITSHKNVRYLWKWTPTNSTDSIVIMYGII